MTTPHQEMCALFARIKEAHDGHDFDLKKLLPILERFLTVIQSRPRDRDAFAKEFVSLVASIDYADQPRGIFAAEHIIDFCMRTLQWPEVGVALKEQYDREPRSAVKLWIERMIREIYDRHWEGGVAELEPQESIWDLLRQPQPDEPQPAGDEINS